jgi:hypothetical protein
VALVVAWFVGFTVYSIGVCNVLYPYVVDGDVELSLLRGLFVVTGVTALAIGSAAWRGNSLPETTHGRLLGGAVVFTAGLALLVMATAIENVSGTILTGTRVAVVAVAAFAETASSVSPRLVYATFAVVSATFRTVALGGAIGARSTPVGSAGPVRPIPARSSRTKRLESKSSVRRGNARIRTSLWGRRSADSRSVSEMSPGTLTTGVIPWRWAASAGKPSCRAGGPCGPPIAEAA